MVGWMGGACVYTQVTSQVTSQNESYKYRRSPWLIQSVLKYEFMITECHQPATHGGPDSTGPCCSPSPQHKNPEIPLPVCSSSRGLRHPHHRQWHSRGVTAWLFFSFYLSVNKLTVLRTNRRAFERLLKALTDQLHQMEKVMLRHMKGTTLLLPEALHFLLPEPKGLVTVVYPAGLPDSQLEMQRKVRPLQIPHKCRSAALQII